MYNRLIPAEIVFIYDLNLSGENLQCQLVAKHP